MTQAEIIEQIKHHITNYQPQNLELIKSLINQVEDINTYFEYEFYEEQEEMEDGEPVILTSTILGAAVFKNNFELVEFLLSFNGVDIDKEYLHEQGSKGITPLALSSSFEDLRIAKKLIAHGARVDQINILERSVLQNIGGRELETFEIIISKGANINHQNDYGEDIIFTSCYKKHYEAVSKLLSYGAYINQTRQYEGGTALHAAAAVEVHNSLLEHNFSKLLLANGYDITYKTKQGTHLYINHISATLHYAPEETPLKYLPLDWITEQLKNTESNSSIFKLELYRGLKYFEHSGSIRKDKAIGYYPPLKRIDYVKGCLEEQEAKLQDTHANDQISIRKIEGFARNTIDILKQIFSTEFDEKNDHSEIKQAAEHFAGFIQAKVNKKKAEFIKEWHKYLLISKDIDNLGNLNCLPKNIKYYLGHFLLNSIADNRSSSKQLQSIAEPNLEETNNSVQLQFIARPILKELNNIEHTLVEFESTLSGLLQNDAEII
ncbi:MAG: ankyrin repeat protein [Rickettsiaceae bacterium]|jgi:ankyrin repeat protein|nr:ankyrin repeat protein [Rickettsiaceae bacterium]